jgi:hypothetical protein
MAAAAKATKATKATRKIYRVEVRKDAGPAGGWLWVGTDARGTVDLPATRRGYTRRADAVRGAKRAHPTAKVVVVS